MSEHVAEAELSLLGRDALPSDRAAAVQAHLDVCPECQAKLDRLGSAVLAPLRVEDTGPMELPPLPPDLRARLQAVAKRDVPTMGIGPPGYEVLEELGRGGMGIVYKARQLGLNRVVALKMVLGGAWAGAEVLRRFLEEAEAVAAVQHPGIVQIHDIGSHEGLPYFALEFCPGGTLSRKLNSAALPAPEAAAVVEQIALAVQAAHDKGILHRDLKPGNVLLDADGRPRVTDFGLARRLEVDSGLTQTGAVLGTPSYMAPEQAQGRKDIGPAADVYALGAILYECLTGRPPFRAASASETIHQVLTCDPPSVRHCNAAVPRDLETICHTALRKEPGKRYASARDMAADLRRWLSGQPILARPAGRLERLAKWARRNPTLATLLAVVVTAVAAGAAGGVWHIRRLDREKQAAQRAEAEALQARHDGRVHAAREAARRGQWPQALALYEQAIAADYPDRPTLELERLRGWFTHEHRDRLVSELGRMSRDPVLGKKAVVRLHHGDFLLSEQGDHKQGLALIAEALAQSGELTEEDAEYGRGLLAAKADDAMRHFRAALAADPFHHRANSALVATLLVLGQFDEARVRAAFVARAYPGDPIPGLATAWEHLVRGNLPDAVRALQAMAPSVGPERAARLVALFRTFDALFTTAATLGHDPWAGIRLAQQLADLRAKYPRSLQPFGFMVPAVTRLAEVLDQASQAWAWRGLNPAGSLKTLEECHARHPDGVLLLAVAICRLRVGEGLRTGGRRAEGYAAIEQAADEAHRAADAPSLMERSGHRHLARCAGFGVDCVLDWAADGSDPDRVQRVRVTLPRLIEEGARHRDLRARVWPAMFREMHGHPAEVRLLLQAWRQDEPNRLELLRALAENEARRGDHARALRWAALGLSLHPRDAELRRLRERARQALR